MHQLLQYEWRLKEMGFYYDFQELKLRFSAKYYELSLANNYEIKELIDNHSVICNLWNKYPLNGLRNIDDYYNMLFANKVMAFESIIPELPLEDADKIVLNTIINRAKTTIVNIKPKEIIDFINNNYHILFAKSHNTYGLSNIDESTFDYVIKYHSGIDLIIKKYICQNLGNIVVKRYEEFEQVIKSDVSLFDELFPQKRLEYAERIGLDGVLATLTRILLKKEEPLYSKAEAMINSLTEDVLILYNSLNADNVLLYEHIVRGYISFLRRITHKNANRFAKADSDLEKLIIESIRRHGNTKTIKVSLEPIIEKISSTDPLLSRIISITHEKDMTTNQLKCRLNSAPIPSIIDEIATSTIPTNAYFTSTHQQKLDLIVTSGAIIIDTIMRDENLTNEILEGYSRIIHFIASETHSDEEELSSDFNLLVQMMSVIYYSIKDDDAIVMNALCYGAAMFICAFSEKILRICYFEEAKNYRYIPLNKATIGILLDSNTEEMRRVLGEYQIRHLNYYLGHEKDNLVGYSYRNRLAHWNEITNSFLNPQFVCRLFYLFSSIINSVSLYYCDKSKSSENTKESCDLT